MKVRLRIDDLRVDAIGLVLHNLEVEQEVSVEEYRRIIEMILQWDSSWQKDSFLSLFGEG